MTGITIAKINKGRYWISVTDAAEELKCSKRKVFDILNEMEALEGKRYPSGITAEIGANKIIDRLALNDYVRHRKKLKAGLKVGAYEPRREAWSLGYVEEYVYD